MRKIFKVDKITRLIALLFLALLAAALPLVPANAAQVAVTVEKLTVDGGFIVEPELVEFTPGAKASEVLDALLGSKNIPFRYDSNLTSALFYVSEIDGLRASGKKGWMITVNNFFIKKSAGRQDLANGDVMRWQYTTKLGADIGTDADILGTSWLPSKDALIWKVAEINAAGNKSSYSAYNAAVSVLKKLDATPEDINSALAALNGDTSGGGDNNDGGSNNSGSNNNNSGGSNNSGTDNNNSGGSNNSGTDNNSGGSNSGADNNGGNSNSGTDSGGSNTGTDNGGSNTDTDSGGSNSGTDNSGSNTGTDNGGSSNTDTDSGTSAAVKAEIRDKPAVTPPAEIEAGINPQNVTGSDIEDLGFEKIFIRNTDGTLSVSRDVFEKALTDYGIELDAEKPVSPLPVFRAGVSKGGTALVTLKASLDAYAGETLGGVSVFKMTYKGSAAKLNRVRSGEALKHGSFVWTDEAGNVIQPTETVTAGKDYFLSVAIKDDSDFDLDGWTEGSIVDPLALAVEDTSSSSENVNQGSGNAWNTPSGGGGGGCDTGAFGFFAPFALAVLAFASTRRKA
jgi:hypothetical protein